MERSELDQLRAELQTMQRRIDELEASSPETPVNRRNMLRGLGAAAVGAAASGLAFARPAAATDGNSLVIGNSTQTAQSPTVLVRDSSTYSTSPAVGTFHVTDDASDTNTNITTALISASATNNGATTAFAAKASSYGAKLDAPVPLKLLDSSAAGAPGDSGFTGQMKVDNGDLWFCTDHTGLLGDNAVWRRLTGPGEAGSYHPVTPARVYDSRLSGGSLAASTNRLVSVANSINPTTGVTVTSNFVPSGATAIVANVTIFSTVNSGNLSINPGGDTSTASSAVNWNASGQVANQGLTFKLNSSRQLTFVCNSTASGSTQFVIDVFGYYL